MFIIILFITAERWKQLKRSPTAEDIHKLGEIHTMEFYSAIKKE